MADQHFFMVKFNSIIDGEILTAVFAEMDYFRATFSLFICSETTTKTASDSFLTIVKGFN